MRRTVPSVGVVVLAFVVVVGRSAAADPIVYSSSAAFHAGIGPSITDTYSHEGYRAGDRGNNSVHSLHIHSNAHMSAVLGETKYRTTGWDDHNLVYRQAPLDYVYCAGCNGSFELGFTGTSVGTSAGVYGVGFDFENYTGYYAFLIFADMSTLNYRLPVQRWPGRFIGFTSNRRIRSLHIGLSAGRPTRDGSFVLDNLTVAAAPVPEPATGALLALGAAGAYLGRRRRR